MKCVFCKTDEKEVRYMLTKDNVCICDNCVLLLSQKLSIQLKEDEKTIINNLKKKKDNKVNCKYINFKENNVDPCICYSCENLSCEYAKCKKCKITKIYLNKPCSCCSEFNINKSIIDKNSK